MQDYQDKDGCGHVKLFYIILISESQNSPINKYAVLMVFYSVSTSSA